jgi:1,4-alpha-glucan branching enzyme
VKEFLNGRISDLSTYLFHEGKNYTSYKFMGSHQSYEKRKKGIRFTVWAPKVKNIYVVGDFCDFKLKEEFKMLKITEMGLWSIFIPDIEMGSKYKYCIETLDCKYIFKADPYAFKSELRPGTASIITSQSEYKWNDRSFMARRRSFNMYESPINIYEVHLGSWKRKNGEFLTYREMADSLPKYLNDMGYTHVEILPIIEHPLDASWGYQGVGYYSVTSRYGDFNDFKYLIDQMHKNYIGVIIDIVPGHFCKDEHGLYKFDGTQTYEYEETWKGENKDWGTCNFDLGKPEVRSFLISNALYWLREFHVDGLRIDAVSNMLYLSYGRKKGEWKPNKYGNDGNLEAIEFFKILNTVVKKEFPTVMMIAEESTSWPKVSKPIEDGGLGFDFKWNMGWMHDTLSYSAEDSIYRKYHHNKITFSMAYNYSENFILPISHDEVVHGKKALIDKMWGDYWNKFAGLRLYIAHMVGHPGKKLIFMGSEFAQFIEWREYEELEWFLIEKFEMHKKTQEYYKAINKFYKENRALWELDYDPNGFRWIDSDNKEQSIFSFIRKSKKEEETLIFICNYTPILYENFRVGVPYLKSYKQVFNTDEKRFGGSGQIISNIIEAEEIPFNNEQYSIKIKVPPMGAIIMQGYDDKNIKIKLKSHKSK